MIDRLIGQGSTVDQLKSGLSDSTRTVRGIAHRVASASARDGDFARALDDAQGAGAAEVVDMEQEMVSLAEEQIRFEAATSLLSKVYEQIRMGIRER